jgi:hypothetical protein
MVSHLKLAASAIFSGLFLYHSVALGVGIDPLDIATILGNALAPTFGPAAEHAWIVISAILFSHEPFIGPWLLT